jgi:hypothetical protein
MTPPKAEYIGADQTVILDFLLAILRRTIHTDNDAMKALQRGFA